MPIRLKMRRVPDEPSVFVPVEPEETPFSPVPFLLVLSDPSVFERNKPLPTSLPTGRYFIEPFLAAAILRNRPFATLSFSCCSCIDRSLIFARRIATKRFNMIQLHRTNTRM